MAERRTQRVKSDLWAELDAEGEAKVRERLVTAFYGEVGERRALVLEWLRSKKSLASKLSKGDKPMPPFGRRTPPSVPVHWR